MSHQKPSSKQIQKGSSYEEIKLRWKNLSPIYIQFDCTAQTFYYTLISMMQLNESKNILEIACGAGLLIPHVLDLKKPETFYYATDISEEMLYYAKLRLEKHFEKYQSKLTLEEWMKKQNLEFAQVNGEQKIPKDIKFDRIICNLVLMLTTDPKKMLENLWNSAEEGCLMGLTVWGDKENTNAFSLVEDLNNEYGLLPKDHRSTFFLADRIETLVQECGWEKLLAWNQKAMYPVIEHSVQKMHPYIEKDILTRFPKDLHPKILAKIDQWINKEKCGLTFDGKVMIVRKRQKKE